MIRCVELTNCPDPVAVVRLAAAAAPDLAELHAALGRRPVESEAGVSPPAEGPVSVELPGARVHVIPLQQELRADGTITPPAAVVIVDGEQADTVDAALREAIETSATKSEEDTLELPDGSKVRIDGPTLVDAGAVVWRRETPKPAVVAVELVSETTHDDVDKGAQTDGIVEPLEMLPTQEMFDEQADPSSLDDRNTPSESTSESETFSEQTKPFSSENLQTPFEFTVHTIEDDHAKRDVDMVSEDTAKPSAPDHM